MSSHLLWLPNQLVEPCAEHTLPDDWDSFLSLGLLNLIITGLFLRQLIQSRRNFIPSSRQKMIFSVDSSCLHYTFTNGIKVHLRRKIMFIRNPNSFVLFWNTIQTPSYIKAFL